MLLASGSFLLIFVDAMMCKVLSDIVQSDVECLETAPCRSVAKQRDACTNAEWSRIAFRHTVRQRSSKCHLLDDAVAGLN